MHPLEQFKFCPKCGSSHFVENNFKSKRCNTCGFVYYFNPSASTAAFIVDDEERLLVAKRAKDPAKGTLDLPGGFVDPYETVEEAIKREVFEETGLQINQFNYLFSLPNIYIYSGFEVHTADLFFQTHVENLSGLQAHDDVEELYLIDKKDIKPELFGLASVRKAVENWMLMR